MTKKTKPKSKSRAPKAPARKAKGAKKPRIVRATGGALLAADGTGTGAPPGGYA